MLRALALAAAVSFAVPAQARGSAKKSAAKKPTAKKQAAGGRCTGQTSSHITSFPDQQQGREPERCPQPLQRWQGARGELVGSGIYRFTLPHCQIDNSRAFASLLRRLHGSAPEYAVAVVPGTSESLGHHHHWDGRDGNLVEAEYRARLRHAFILLQQGLVHSVVLSGGSIDPHQHSYNEGVFGYLQMLREFGPRWRGAGPLRDRLIVDPWAFHTHTNVRNGDKVAALAGLDRDIFITTVGGGTAQGAMFQSPHVYVAALNFSRWTLDWFAHAKLGYEAGTLGSFAMIPWRGTDVFGSATAVRGAPALIGCDRGRVFQYCVSGKYRTAVFPHWDLRRDDVVADHLWDCGVHDTGGDACWAPDFAAVGDACVRTGVTGSSWGRGSPYARPAATKKAAAKKGAKKKAR